MMGKYMRKAKLSGEVAVMEVAAHQPSLGVRTRARALAAGQDSSLAYLELRSRRLEKPLPPAPASKTKAPPKDTPDSSRNPRLSSQKVSRSPTSNSGTRRCYEKGGEVSLCENVLEAESRERETTPCSLTWDSETMATPGSTTRSSNSIVGNQRMQNLVLQNIPTGHEMEEFFVGLEKLQQQAFIEKYTILGVLFFCWLSKTSMLWFSIRKRMC
ncbi:cyclin-dependent kinase inhibitor 5-like isoform X1 [Musa acuminata AAA Group]|uniref:cyclin-dependent kinase inhibitor 5-like isoform X1 n=1 Tax=Musa acuminata AAA Group TaxID=214697 RepID=UPI0031D2D608